MHPADGEGGGRSWAPGGLGFLGFLGFLSEQAKHFGLVGTVGLAIALLCVPRLVPV